MKKILLLITTILCIHYSFAQQIIENPVAAEEQSHQDLNINFIALYTDSTVISLSFENTIAQGGWFCADKKIYIETTKEHQRFNILKAIGIPRCPDVYKFKRAGEKLIFTLVFPAIPKGTVLLNLVEDCDKSCFNFKSIILDAKINQDIRLHVKGVELYAANKIKEAIECFQKVVEVIPSSPTHVYGYSYFNLIRIYYNSGDKVTAKFWLDQLEKSSLPDKQYFITTLQKEGINLK
jgi:tetratricopeptide (TPR) repeat protein